MKRITREGQKNRGGILNALALLCLILGTGGAGTAVAQSPDLQIIAATFADPAAPGDLLEIDLTARNSGTFMAMGTLTSESGYMVDLVLSTDDHVPAGFAIFDSHFSEDVLLAGGRISNTADIDSGSDLALAGIGILPVDTPSGVYQLCAVIDPGDNVEELDEGNNSFCQSLTVANLQPDLELIAASVPATIGAGETLSVELTAYNIGTVPGPGTNANEDGYMIDLVLSTDSQVPDDFAIFSASYAEDVLLRGGRISNTDDLGPNEFLNYVETGVVPADTPPGQYQLCLVIDPGNAVVESNESNNSLCQSLTVFLAQPDLEITSAAFPTIVEQGAVVDVELTARNSGTAVGPGTDSDVDGYMIDLVLSTDDQVPHGFALFNAAYEEDVLLGAGRISNTADLDPGEDLDFSESSTLPLDTPPGDYRLCLTIDAGDSVLESDEGNNTICQTLIVVERTIDDVPTAVSEVNGAGPADFRLGQNYPNPFNPSTTIRFALPLQSSVQVRVFDVLGRLQATLVQEVLQAGQYAVDFDAGHLASGVYYYRIDAGAFSQTRKFTLVK